MFEITTRSSNSVLPEHRMTTLPSNRATSLPLGATSKQTPGPCRVKPQYVPGFAAGGGCEAVQLTLAEHGYVVFVAVTVTDVVAVAVPVAVVGEMKRPLTA